MAVVTVEKNRYTVDTVKQWDKNQVLEIRGLSLAKTPEIHFTNAAMGAALPRSANMDAAGVITALIPDSLLQKPYKIIAYVCMTSGATFETLYKIEIPIDPRPMPADYTLTDGEEVYSFRALEEKLDDTLKTSIERYNAAYTLLQANNEKIASYETELGEYREAAENYAAEVKDLHTEFDEVTKDFTEATANYNAAKTAYDEAAEILGRLEAL